VPNKFLHYTLYVRRIWTTSTLSMKSVTCVKNYAWSETQLRERLNPMLVAMLLHILKKLN